jgi:CBS domain containing-hemolysin-like protein
MVLGMLAAAAGTALIAGAGAVSRLVLARWVSRRQSGSAVAAALLSAPVQVIGPGQLLVAGGLVLAGVGGARAVASLGVWSGAAVLVLGMPILLAVTYAVPRAIGHRWPEPLVRAAAPPLERVRRVSRLLFPGDVMLAEGARRGSETVGEDEIVVLAGVLTFTDRTVREVMTPRTDIVAIEESASVREAAVLLTESGYSRVPVFRDSLDQIMGMAYVFDLLKVGTTDRLPLRPVLAVPESRHCADVLFEMQRERRHLAVVLDEFGGTAGIVTLEDLLEELVGEIFDERESVVAGAGETELLDVDGTVPVQEIADRFGVALPGGRETLGGMLATALGRIPRAGERIVVGGIEFDVLRASATRVEQVIIRRADSVSVTVVGS